VVGRGGIQITVVVVGALLVCSCKRKTQSFGDVARTDIGDAAVELNERAPSGSLLAERFRFRVVVYNATKPKLDVEKELRVVNEASGFLVLTEGKKQKAEQRSSVLLAFPPIEKLAPPDADTLEYFAKGLSEKEKRALATSRSAIALEFTGKGESALVDYKKALELSLALARKLGGFLWDDETRNAYTVESFGARLESWKDGYPDIADHVNLHSYRDKELVRIVSLGMVKFGLPDVVVNEVSGSDSRSMGTLVNLVCQSLVERGKLDRVGALQASLDRIRQPLAKKSLTSDLKPNAKRAVDLTLTKAKLEEGDADNRLLEIAFPGPKAHLQERHGQVLSTLFGSEDGISHITHDAEIKAASERARKKLFAMRARYEKGPPFGEQLSVKAPFATPDGNTEWMWVEVVRWNGNTIHGILDNDPFEIPTLKVGARVDVPADRVFDYILTKRDGTEEGNETGAIIERTEQQKSAP